ncbi:class I SAM-dependent methyltransferase [Pseudacidovorax sp. RU35E]|uniref:class I SAM-dependent methyltransferase n=1 Tax=Pseudacidovorax sp. RU35E TaxID=1907403 RepID=UPI0009570E52|nr:class I SAM-dependent methyltransferase [Pseudacidovorax sp. RU35E]SIR43197.1 Methyltransferase domain-containing protein [Pseudacidovorax sp. RU35E]
MSTDLTTIFRQHQGHLSDKWEQYLAIYEAYLQPRVREGRPLRLLEIGVQNGGSLQIWKRYLPPGSSITGVDVDPACGRLDLGPDVRIHIADASSADALQACLGDARFDVVIDDGSHRSSDIVSTFVACFGRVVPGGLYVIEDLHASYMPPLGGGFWAPQAAIEWLKLLADAIHADYLSSEEIDALNLRAGADVREMARDIASLSFFDSVAVVERSVQSRAAAFRRVMSGSRATVTDAQAHLAQLPRDQLRSLLLTPTAMESLGQGILAKLASTADQLQAEIAQRAALDQRLANAHAAEAEAAKLRDSLAGVESQLAEARERVHSAELRAHAARSEAEAVDHERQRAAAAEAALTQVLNSTTWRATLAFRRAAALLPPSVRATGRRAAKVLWWTASGQLGARLKARRDAMDAVHGGEPSVSVQASGGAEPEHGDSLAEERALVVESGFFDADYYVEANADVAASGTEPLDHFLAHGWREGRDPGERFSIRAYIERYPDVGVADVNPLIHFLRFGRNEGRSYRAGKPLRPTLRQLQQERWPALRALPIYEEPASVGRRLNIVTDSVGVSSLFGGVGTSLILAALLCERLGGTLRLVTRHERPDASAIGAVLSTNGIVLDRKVETAFIPEDDSEALSVGPEDIFLTTSWWTTRATLGAIAPERIVYLLQEDERMFYPYGDERLLCAELLSDSRLSLIVNTGLLLNHFRTGPDPLPALSERAIAFEPAFPGARPLERRERAGKRNFFFYARPHHPRNLFWRGADALAAAIEDGILDPQEWEFHWVGAGVPALCLPCGVVPRRVEGLGWRDYQSLVRSMDAALVLMHTPHPSYPPLDLAGAGVAVLTNSFPGKSDLSFYSRNIITTSVALGDLCEGLSRTAALARNEALRLQQCAQDGIARDWKASLGPVLEHVAAKFNEV